MNFEESAKKLYTLPWQALYDLAVEKQIDGEEIKHKEKTEIIRRLLLSDITEAEIEAVIDDYTYGNRVTFTLWGFSKTLSVEDISALKALEQTEEDYIDVEGFRNLKYVSLKTCSDRLEMIYSYSKEYLGNAPRLLVDRNREKLSCKHKQTRKNVDVCNKSN